MWTSNPMEGFGHTEESFSNIYSIQTRNIDIFFLKERDRSGKHSVQLEKVKQNNGLKCYSLQ